MDESVSELFRAIIRLGEFKAVYSTSVNPLYIVSNRNNEFLEEFLT